MATPSEMIVVVAKGLGIDESIVRTFDRRLQEAGIRTSTGRGRGSAQMGAEDIAALVLALLLTDTASSAAAAYESANKLHVPQRFESEESPEEYLERIGITGIAHALNTNPKRLHRLSSAVEALIELLATRRDTEFNIHTQEMKIIRPIMGRVSVATKNSVVLSAKITIYVAPKRTPISVEYIRGAVNLAQLRSGMTVERSVDLSTLSGIARRLLQEVPA